MEEKLSFKEIYLRFKSKPSPGQQFINEISNLTMRKPATVRMWLADFRQHMQEGDATDDRDGSIMKTLVEAIIVWDDRIEVRFKCGATVEQKYVA